RQCLQAQRRYLGLGGHAGPGPVHRHDRAGPRRRVDRLRRGRPYNGGQTMIRHAAPLPLLLALAGCGVEEADLNQTGPRPELPAAEEALLPAMNIATPTGWEGELPTVPEGFAITPLATDLLVPRQILVLPNGDIL